ncbi:hypothetical protein SDC9_158468 [bioreactor metagenome]|uniref:ATPase AAA-type core domain-containing protein n=1 Tax=bioreactor metagenome TaxID=1076179 RepID=A0A645FA83_9ZZZZ
MKVKYSLAVALSHNSELFILDEPTSGLDPISRDEILYLFQQLVSDGTRSVLFSTHITSDLDKCADSITYIRNGQLVVSNKSKDEFIACYKLVSGPLENLTDDIKSKLISWRPERQLFTGLVEASKASLIPENVKVSTPDLEDIMVFLERGNGDEESII